MPTLDPCPRCARHVRHTEAACPFCGARLLPGWAPPRFEIDPRLPRSTQLLFHALMASAVLVRCNDRPPQHAPVPPPAVHTQREVVPASTPDASTDAAADAQSRAAEAGADAHSRAAVVPEYGGSVVIFEGFMFASGSARTEPTDAPMLREIATVLKARPELQLELHGSRDAGETAKDLAIRRAEHVRKRLVALGIAEDRLFVFDSDVPRRHPAGDVRNRFVRVIVRVPDAG